MENLTGSEIVPGRWFVPTPHYLLPVVAVSVVLTAKKRVHSQAVRERVKAALFDLKKHLKELNYSTFFLPGVPATIVFVNASYENFVFTFWFGIFRAVQHEPMGEYIFVT